MAKSAAKPVLKPGAKPKPTIEEKVEASLEFGGKINQADSKKKKSRGGKSGVIPPGYARLTANIPEELHKKLKVKAAMEGRSIVDILEELIEKNL